MLAKSLAEIFKFPCVSNLTCFFEGFGALGSKLSSTSAYPISVGFFVKKHPSSARGVSFTRTLIHLVMTMCNPSKIFSSVIKFISILVVYKKTFAWWVSHQKPMKSQSIACSRMSKCILSFIHMNVPFVFRNQFEIRVIDNNFILFASAFNNHGSGIYHATLALIKEV